MFKKISFTLILIFCSLWISDYFALIKFTVTPEFNKKLSDKIEKEIVLRGPIIMRFLPWPSFHIQSIHYKLNQKNFLELEKISTPLNLFKLLTFPSLVDLLSMNNMTIKARDLFYRGDPLFFQKLSQLDSNLVLKVAKVNLAMRPDISLKDVIFSFNKKFASDGIIISQGNESHYKFELEDPISSLILENTSARIKMEVKDLNLQQLDFSEGYLQLLIDKDSLNKKDLAKPIVEGNLLNFMGNFTRKDGMISLDNYQIDSAFLKNPSLKLDFYKVKEDLYELKSQVTAEKLDLTFLQNTIPPDTIIEIITHFFPYLTHIKNINCNSLFEIQEIDLKNSKIEKFILDFYNVMGRVFVKNLSGNIQNVAKIDLSGLVRHNGIRSKFEGNLQMQSDKANALMNWYASEDIQDIPALPLFFASDFSVMQNYINLNNLRAKLGETQIFGKAILSEIPYVAPSNSYFLQVNNINFNDFKLNEKLNNYLDALYLADSDKSGEKYFNLTAAHKNLRLLKNASHLEGIFQEVTWQDAKLNQVQIKGSVSSNSLKLDEVIFNHPGLTGLFQLSFQLPILRPEIKVKMDLQELELDFLKKFLPEKFFTREINGFAGNHYDLTGDFIIKNLLLQDQKTIKNLTSLIELERGNLKLNKGQCQFEEGEIALAGDINLNLMHPTFNLDFNLYNLPGYLLPQTLSLEGGLWSLAGSLSGSDEGLSSLDGGAEFAGAQGLILGFDLNKAIEILEGSYTKESKLKALDYYSKYGSTAFNKLTGKIEIHDGVFSIPSMTLLNNRIAGAYSLIYNPQLDEMKSLGNFTFISKLNKEQISVKAEVSSQNKIRSSKVDYSALKNLLTE